MKRKIRQWKGFLNIDRNEFFVFFKKRVWYQILKGEDLILIPFEEDFKPIEMELLEDEEWEYLGEVLTAWRGTSRKVRLVIFGRR